MEPEVKVIDTPQSTPETTNAVVENKTEETPESIQQINWKRFREEREKERKAKEESDKRAAQKEAEAEALKKAMEAILNKPQDMQQNYIPEDSDDDKINKAVRKALEEERIRQEQAQREKEQREIPIRLVQSFPDFDKVCTSENLDYFEFHHPEAAAPYKELPESFDKWAKIYRAIKRYVPNPGSHKEASRAEKNFNKPQSMAVGGTTSTGDNAPQMLTESKKNSNWERMQKRMKGLA